jgi:hypothetical protein
LGLGRPVGSYVRLFQSCDPRIVFVHRWEISDVVLSRVKIRGPEFGKFRELSLARDQIRV